MQAHQSRDPDPRLFGGWSYYYPDGRTYDRWPRASITAWQVMALESARLGGLAVEGLLAVGPVTRGDCGEVAACEGCG